MRPRLRFPEFHGPWRVQPLSDMLIEAKKRNYDDEYTKQDVFSVSGEFGIVNQIELQGRSFAGASVHNYHVVETGDIVYTKSPLKLNPYGIIKYNPGQPGIVSTLYAVYRPKGNTVPKFLDYYFQLDDNVNKYLRPLVHKGAKNDMKISNSHVLDGYISAPGREEQEKIADFLTAVDKRIAAGEKKLELLQQYKKGIMQKIFTQQIRFKDESRKDYPDWKTKAFGDLVRKVTDSYNPTTSSQVYKDIELESLSQSTGRLLKTFPSNQQKSMKIKFKERDILYGKLRPYLRKFYFADFSGVTTSEIWVFRSKAVSKFLYYLVQSDQFSSVVDVQAGSKMPRADWKTVAKEVFLIPREEEQQKIATFLTTLDEKITAEQTKLTATRQFKKALLQRMFV